MKLKSAIIVFGIVFATASTVVLMASTTPYLRSLGLCWAQCYENRKNRYLALFDGWFQREAFCLSPQEQLALLDKVDPKLSGMILRQNEVFEQYKEKQLEGELTVAERDAYLSSDWRVPPHRPNILTSHLFPNSSVQHENEETIKACPKEGFEFNDVGEAPTQMCFGYVFVQFNSEYKPIALWDNVALRAYEQHKRGGELEGFLSAMEEDMFTEYFLKLSAEKKISELPANQVPIGTQREKIQEEFLKLRCKKIAK